MPVHLLLGFFLALLPKNDAPSSETPAGLFVMTEEMATVWDEPPGALPSEVEAGIVTRAREEVERGVVYDRSYRFGEVPEDRGACTDVVIRALRAVGVDLQALVVDDMRAAPEAYKRPIDRHGDYRRVAVLSVYFERHARAIASDLSEPSLFRPGDIVFTSPRKPCKPRRPCAATHVALISDRIGPRGLPLVIQNGGPVATESDVLTEKTVLVAHYRVRWNDATK